MQRVSVVNRHVFAFRLRLKIPVFRQAIYNSLFRATTVKGFKGTVPALPLARTLQLLGRAGVLGKAGGSSATVN